MARTKLVCPNSVVHELDFRSHTCVDAEGNLVSAHARTERADRWTANLELSVRAARVERRVTDSERTYDALVADKHVRFLHRAAHTRQATDPVVRAEATQAGASHGHEGSRLHGALEVPHANLVVKAAAIDSVIGHCKRVYLTVRIVCWVRSRRADGGRTDGWRRTSEPLAKVKMHFIDLRSHTCHERKAR